MIITIIINVKSFLERHFCGSSIHSFLKQTYFHEKKLYCIQSLRCTAKLDKFYAIYLVLTKEMAQKGDLWPGATKINLKNMKT